MIAATGRPAGAPRYQLNRVTNSSSTLADTTVIVRTKIPAASTVIEVDLDRILRRFLQEALMIADTDQYLRRAMAWHQVAVRPPDRRPELVGAYRRQHDNEIVQTADWPPVTRPGSGETAEQVEVRRRVAEARCWAYRELADHPESRSAL